MERIPAHIGCQVMWLNIDEMEKFESAYTEWEKALYTDLKEEASDSKGKSSAALAYNVYKVLKELKKEKKKRSNESSRSK